VSIHERAIRPRRCAAFIHQRSRVSAGARCKIHIVHDAAVTTTSKQRPSRARPMLAFLQLECVRAARARLYSTNRFVPCAQARSIQLAGLHCAVAIYIYIVLLCIYQIFYYLDTKTRVTMAVRESGICRRAPCGQLGKFNTDPRYGRYPKFFKLKLNRPATTVTARHMPAGQWYTAKKPVDTTPHTICRGMAAAAQRSGDRVRCRLASCSSRLGSSS